MSAGSNLRKAVEEEVPLQVVGTINAYCARLAERAGFKALYLSGAGVANASFGLPDLAITTMNDVIEDARRITQAVDLPLLVDIDVDQQRQINRLRDTPRILYDIVHGSDGKIGQAERRIRHAGTRQIQRFEP